MRHQRTADEMAALIAKRRLPKTEEHKAKIRESNRQFWAKAKALYEQQSQNEK